MAYDNHFYLVEIIMESTSGSPEEHKLSEYKKGLLTTLTAYLIWATLSIYWKLLSDVPAIEILCHRILWSFVFLLLYLTLTGQLRDALTQFRNKKIVLQLFMSCAVLTCNWFIFIWAITNNRVIETSLGYYINPLLNILVGIVFLKEEKNTAIFIALILATIGVLIQIFALGAFPFVALGLGVSFCIYSVIRKVIHIEAAPGLFIETSLSMPFALAFIGYLYFNGKGAFLYMDGNTDALLVFAGVLTSLPLLLFTYGARRITLTTMGIMQYISPTLTFFFGIFLFKETFTVYHLMTFGCIWLALLIYTVSSLHQSKTAEPLRKRAKH